MHSYLLLGEEQPQCVGCDAPFTVRHFLLECGDFAQVRNNCFHVDNMKQLFQYKHIDNMVVDRRDHVQYLTVSKSYSDNCTCSLTEQNTTLTNLYYGLIQM